MAPEMVNTTANIEYDPEAGKKDENSIMVHRQQQCIWRLCIINAILLGACVLLAVLAFLSLYGERLADEPSVEFERRPFSDTAFSSQTYVDGTCHVYGGPNQLDILKGKKEAYMTLSNSGTAYGVTGGSCDVTAIEKWAKYVPAECNQSTVVATLPWLMLWQGATSVSQQGSNIKSIRMSVGVPSTPQAKNMDFSYSAWFFGMQPGLQRDPPIPPEGAFCDLEGQDNTVVYNSGQFSRIFYRSQNSRDYVFQDRAFNKQQTWQDWNERYVYGSNILLGKSKDGATFGYLGDAGKGDVLQFNGQFGHASGHEGWKNTIKKEGRDEKVVFAFNNTVYENVFLQPAIDEGVIANRSTTQAKLVLESNWSWAVGPPYEMSQIDTKPLYLHDIPNLWPREPIVYNDLEMIVSDGGDWELNKEGKAWFLDFAEGLEITGQAFGGKLFTDYGALESYVQDELSMDDENFEAVQCVYACLKSRFDGSKCDTKEVRKGFVRAQCVLQFDPSKPFPPQECDR